MTAAWFAARSITGSELAISAPSWTPTPEEEAGRARQAAAGMEEFLGQLTGAIEQHQRARKDPEEGWDEHDYERFLKEGDARTDKYMEQNNCLGISPPTLEKTAVKTPICASAEPVLAAPPPGRNLIVPVLTCVVIPGTGYCGSGSLSASTTNTPMQ